ncbi:RNA-directed RNA polymerase [Armillaria luteobubalina]|uniref:RNA-directed RNA polymerase n=1 Tax=Armillaria luteobubalina TaxID=153913 RepID=A0AA39Q144_9AGAR|nr:RNA-directed RNA polymerase [Armillaria luteobubalina]
MPPYTLRADCTKDNDSWSFQVPPAFLIPRQRPGRIMGKFVRFDGANILLETTEFSSNRILQSDDPSKFILVAFGALRLPDTRLRESGEYIARFLKEGLFLNGVQYRFYHHSNSQLRGRSCFLREAMTDQELDDRIYVLGSFGKIMNVAKRAKRIGLLYSESQLDFQLNPNLIADISDIVSGGVEFSDGCGLMSRRLAVQVSKSKKIIFRGVRYTPCVFQIRYLGYKGHPLAQFRKSMKKFSTIENPTFSVVGYSKPYTFGRLNNEIIVLLSSLGIPNENFLKKQDEYFDWLRSASYDPMAAVDFLSVVKDFGTAEKVLLDGLDDPKVSAEIRRFQNKEIADFRKDGKKERSRMIIKKSRKIYGVCDPFQVLKEGQVHIRITTGRGGPSTPIHGDVLVVRNPCLHPGDCLKLRAVHHEKLSHLVDCIVFASVARRGHPSAPSMSSGGDLDGDEYFVCWDPDLVPATVSEPYDYPPNKERVNKIVTREDLSRHFAQYNNAGLARVAALHSKWAISSPKGALCSECQELNALHSQSVDGASIKIPDRLTSPPEPPEDSVFIIKALADAASQFAGSFAAEMATLSDLTTTVDMEDAEELIVQLLRSNQSALSEYELYTLAYRLALKHSLDHRVFLSYINFGALTTDQKHSLSYALNLSREEHASLWNSLLRSDLLGPADMYQRNLAQPFSLQRLYSSKIQGHATFFTYLQIAMQDFTRKVLLLKTDDRFVLAVFIRGKLPWDEDPEVNENVVVCSFLPHTSGKFSSYRPCTPGYRLYCSPTNFQLYNKHRADSFVFLTRPPKASGAEVAISVALQKISNKVRQNVGRVYREPITGIELHVVSNRDRISHQLFDLWFEHVPTENRVRRFDREIRSYTLNDLLAVDWESTEDPQPKHLRDLFKTKLMVNEFTRRLSDTTAQQWKDIVQFALMYHAEEEVFWTFSFVISQPLPLGRESVMTLMELHPPLVFSLLKKYPPEETENVLPPETEALERSILHNIIRCANGLSLATLVALEKLSGTIARLTADVYFDLLMQTALSVRAPQVVQEVLFVLNDSRATLPDIPPEQKYGNKFALGIAFDRAEEAADECPCNEDGRPRKQRTAPVKTTMQHVPENPLQVKVPIRVDSRTPIRLHSHVRLQAASEVEKTATVEVPVLDGVVVQSLKGEMTIELQHPPPPEMERMDWNMYNAGSIATSKAMMDALIRLLMEKEECCRYHHLITGETSGDGLPTTTPDPVAEFTYSPDLNESQIEAIKSCEAPLSLIWGPPGTGKTTVVVQILRKILQSSQEPPRILMTASTHNAVDNVLERFVKENNEGHYIRDEQILRVATDVSKVNKDLQGFTIDARVGGDMNENNRLFKQAQKRLNDANLVFTTCAGAGLGILRKSDFDIALIDEASQITEPCALIPLVKGTQRAILIQYRFPQELADFPSREFYEGRLRSGLTDSSAILSVLTETRFPWPVRPPPNIPIPTVFIPCSTEEDMGGLSKSNIGQVEVVHAAISLLTPSELSITVLSPYRKQIDELKHKLSSNITCATIDSFQGRESDIIMFSSVRSNAERDIGFVDDARRLNVMWTRARKALIIVGDRATMESNALWKRALSACTEVIVEMEAN